MGRRARSGYRMYPALRLFPISPKERNARGPGKFSPLSAPTLNIPTSRRVTRRPCVNGKRCARRRNKPGDQEMILHGPQTRFGLAVAAVACLLDQASKLYLLFIHDLAAHPIRLGP